MNLQYQVKKTRRLPRRVHSFLAGSKKDYVFRCRYRRQGNYEGDTLFRARCKGSAGTIRMLLAS